MSRSASRLLPAPPVQSPAPALDARTAADLAVVGDTWLSPACRDQFVADATKRRADPVFRFLEEVAEAHLGLARLVALGSDRLDFREVYGPCLAEALRAAYEAGRAAGRRSGG